MKRKQLFIIYLICFILQITIMHHFTICGTSPDLLLVLVMVFSFFYEDFNGLAFGILFGILRDICVGPAAGVSSIMFFIIGLGLQLVRFAVYRDNKFILFLVTAVCVSLYYMGCLAIVTVLLEMNISLMSVAVRLPAAIVWNYVTLLIVCHFARKTHGFKV